MPKVDAFNTYHSRYDAWFARHREAYHSELMAIRASLPLQGLGLEIGVGSGRFAAPLGVEVGVDPSKAMLAYAIERGIFGIQGIAEALPFGSEIFDYALSVTTICFVDDPTAMLTEAYRVLKHGAVLIIGFIDRTSPMGKHYVDHQDENVFYRGATFYSASEVKKLFNATGFANPTWAQTLFKPLDQIREIEPLRAGYGDGSFVVIRATKL
jgi:SAM-dependent methyltransferase